MRTTLLKSRRERARFDLEREKLAQRGFERISENGDPLWELQRGLRFNQQIIECEIDPDGKTVWIKIAGVA